LRGRGKNVQIEVDKNILLESLKPQKMVNENFAPLFLVIKTLKV
jgi:hypothetical protein